jgi:superoxide reductase
MVFSMNHALFYRCERCGNIVALVKSGSGVLNCCGQPMTELIANSTDGAQEKHVPVAVQKGDKIQVTVGSVIHPMVKEHYIEWIALVSGDRIEIKYLQPGMKPTAEFSMPAAQTETIFTGENDEEVLNCEGQPCNFVCPPEKSKPITVYEYCNLHGLWKSEL